MSAGKHTPGPWLSRGLHIVGPADARSQHPDGRILIGGVVDDANDWRGHPINSAIERAEFAEEREANARLIATAPELLSVARSVAGIGFHFSPERDTCLCSQCALVREARAVVSKATGES